MSLANKNFSTYEEFEKMRNDTNNILEYLDGIIYMSPSPSIRHQRIASYLHGELYHILRNSNCEVFSSPTDVLFDKNVQDTSKNKRVVPDLFITCKTENFTENEYVGAPEFIIEILSPSNKSHDLVRKLNLYMEHGVKEYWIVDPLENRILIYSLDENEEVQMDFINKGGVASSRLFKNIKIEADVLFGV